ncbi:MAG: ABC transporter permease, partial [Anaerolineae bacterium]
MSTVWFIAELTLREAGRRRILWLVGALSLAFLAIFAVGLRIVYAEVVRELPIPDRQAEMASFFSVAGLYAANFLVIMLSVLSAVDTVSGEIASHSIQSLVAKPIRRWQVILGKWLGYALLLLGAVLALGGGVVAVSWAITGYLMPNPLLGLSLIYLESLILASLTILGGTRLSTLANGVLVFMLFGLAFLGGWTEQVGGFV